MRLSNNPDMNWSNTLQVAVNNSSSFNWSPAPLLARIDFGSLCGTKHQTKGVFNCELNIEMLPNGHSI